MIDTNCPDSNLDNAKGKPTHDMSISMLVWFFILKVESLKVYDILLLKRSGLRLL